MIMADGRVNNGGARPNSGPKPKAEKFESAIAAADLRISENLVRYIENLERLADGVTVSETDREGKEHIYTRAPDRQANEYLINRIMGKPTERKEVTGEDGEPLNIRIVYGDNGVSRELD